MEMHVMSASYEDGEEPKQLEATAHKGGTNDIFDIERLRIRQDFTASLVAQRILSTVPVRKPPKQQFVRVHPDPSWQLRTAVLHLKEEGEMYLVDPSLWRDLADEIVPHILFTAVNRQGTYFIWPVRLPREDGRMDEWAYSALAAAKLGMGGDNHLVRFSDNHSGRW